MFLDFALIFLCCHLVSSALPRPKLYGNAIPDRDVDPNYSSTRKKIVLYHNFFRARVNPPASNMLQVSWHDGATEDAERWAQACQVLLHDNITGRWVDDYGSCGQNIFIANVRVSWFFAIKVWFLEHLNFTYNGSNNIPSVVGHYTQMVWYNSHRIGCSYYYCGPNVTAKPYHSYICNYCPIGNYPDRFSRPYDTGEPCSKCPGQCKYNKLCTNGCDYGDFWANCGELNSTWHNWLCDDENQERSQACRATCRCNGKIL
ncbi:cysteine-rich venom protein LEI1-like [Centruroides vittatus]|uniref:cysteine-rich venom protein LEI1-like n=1 Tax=Centruroides vittatus TaxID=120091 RepID=UPI00350FC03C